MWSCAVILGKLFMKVKRGNKNTENLIETLLFAGTQCFPLSPKQNEPLEADGLP
jgi:hypothetical protein